METHHVSKWKKELVGNVVKSIDKTPVVGLVSVRGVPGPQLQKMRAQLRGHITMQVMKNTLLEIALKEASKKKKGLEQLVPSIDGQMAILLSDYNPFKLYKLLAETKTKMAAKGGEIAPMDIEVKAGDTPFKPGPIVGELQKAGIPAAIEQGKVIIKKDKLLVKAGDKISKDIATALTKLEIYPLTVGLELKAAYEEGIVFPKETLAIDQSAYLAQVQDCAKAALNLSVYAAIPNRMSIRPLLSKAYMEALSLAVNSEYPTKESIKLLLAKANAQSIAVASRLPADVLDEKTKSMLSNAPPSGGASGGTGEKKEEPKEEKKEEKK
ncbi:MAG: 50S ribosomal protein L10, partial [Thermoplasmata archaeon]